MKVSTSYCLYIKEPTTIFLFISNFEIENLVIYLLMVLRPLLITFDSTKDLSSNKNLGDIFVSSVSLQQLSDS